jgi:hypothetical protein
MSLEPRLIGSTGSPSATGPGLISMGAAKCEIQALRAQYWVPTVFEWQDAVMPETRRATPDHNIAVLKWNSASRFRSRVAAK